MYSIMITFHRWSIQSITLTITQKTVIDCNRLRLTITITPCLVYIPVLCFHKIQLSNKNSTVSHSTKRKQIVSGNQKRKTTMAKKLINVNSGVTVSYTTGEGPR